MYVEYSSNNSGGGWWLNDSQWHALASAGWEWETRDRRFLGALTTRATRHGLSLRDAIAEWEMVTGERASVLGCNCCGPPHNFTSYNDEGLQVDYYSPSAPLYGDDPY